MHTLLQKWMTKRGVTLETMTSEEKLTFDQWNKTLSNQKVTITSIRDFCDLQKSLIELQFGDLMNPSQKNDRLVLLHTVYSKIIQMTYADKNERESLERYLTQMIDTTPS